MALEPLACAIRSNGDIHGVNIHGHDFKLNMYADDILLTLSKPAISIPAVLNLINLFGSFSGYKINWNIGGPRSTFQWAAKMFQVFFSPREFSTKN